MAQAKSGDTVKVNYTGKLTDGSEFDSSKDREPLQFTIGEGQLILGFEEAIVGMNIGDSKTVNVPVEKAYGPHREEWVMDIDRNEFPKDLEPEVGQRLQLRQDDGEIVVVQVSAVTEETVTLDANHPLAGEDLIFEIELLEIA